MINLNIRISVDVDDVDDDIVRAYKILNQALVNLDHTDFSKSDASMSITGVEYDSETAAILLKHDLKFTFGL